MSRRTPGHELARVVTAPFGEPTEPAVRGHLVPVTTGDSPSAAQMIVVPVDELWARYLAEPTRTRRDRLVEPAP